MTASGPAESPLQAVGTSDRATEAFELLGNETRLAILVALWERYEPFEPPPAVRFSELRERVGTADSGQFNYHLDRLDGHFVTSTDAGYRLTDAGLKLVRSVIAGAGLETPEREPARVEASCTLCGGPVEVRYADGWVHVRCTECEGLWPGADDRPSGQLGQFALDPAGLTDRTPAEVYAAGWVRTFQHVHSMIEGVCPTCTGPVERELDVCADHEDDDGLCGRCGRRARVIARFRCSVCKDWARSTLGGVAKYHPRVVGFCYDRGLSLQYGANDLDHLTELLSRASTTVEVLSTDPARVRVTTELDGDNVRLELDADLAVLDVEG
ncbi:MAG: ArsR family transcriptional regulator [Halobacteriales archaeon]